MKLDTADPFVYNAVENGREGTPVPDRTGLPESFWPVQKSSPLCGNYLPEPPPEPTVGLAGRDRYIAGFFAKTR